MQSWWPSGQAACRRGSRGGRAASPRAAADRTGSAGDPSGRGARPSACRNAAAMCRGPLSDGDERHRPGGAPPSQVRRAGSPRPPRLRTAGWPATRTIARASSRSPGPQCTSTRHVGHAGRRATAPGRRTSPRPRLRAGPKAPLSLKTTSGPSAGRAGKSRREHVRRRATRRRRSSPVPASSGCRGTPIVLGQIHRMLGRRTTRHDPTCRPRAAGSSGSVRRAAASGRAKPTRRRAPPANASAAVESELGTMSAMSARSAAQLPRDRAKPPRGIPAAAVVKHDVVEPGRAVEQVGEHRLASRR